MKTARQTAVETLLRVEEGGAWSNLALDHMIGRNSLSQRDSALAAALVYGTLERRLTLDACVAAHSRMKLKKLSPVVLAILRTALYQLLYMDKVPDRSAVNEAVELAKRMRMAKASGYINGVLRSFLRADKTIPLPKEPEQERLSVEYSVPVPLIHLWMEAYGAARTLHLLEDSLKPAPVHLRVNTLKTTPEALLRQLETEGIRAELSPHLPHCLTLAGQGAARNLPGFEEGLFHIQDISSQLCVMALGTEPGMRILDACAAPGGKSATLAQYMENTGELAASELHPQRVALIEKQAARLGILNLTAFQADMREPQPQLGLYDRVLVDAPCSGLGVIRRKPEIKYRPLEEFAELPEIQYKILSSASQYCRAGGRLLYSTCALNPAENGDVARRFLEEHPKFAPSPLPEALGGDWERTLTAEFGGDGFYTALFERKAL